MLVFVFIKK